MHISVDKWIINRIYVWTDIDLIFVLLKHNGMKFLKTERQGPSAC